MSDAHTGAGDIGRRVAHRRQELGLSREELAERCDMAPGYIAYLEEKPAVVPPDTLTKLAGGLETTPRQLLGGLSERPPGATPGAAASPRLEELDPDECLRLISPGGVGRIAFNGRFGLTVLPVNYRIHEGAIVFRTVAGGTTDEDLRTGWAGVEFTVAFEVDRLDEAMREGWSVLVQGPLHHVTEEERRELTRLKVEPWAGGERELYLRITPTRMTGRRVRATA